MLADWRANRFELCASERPDQLRDGLLVVMIGQWVIFPRFLCETKFSSVSVFSPTAFFIYSTCFAIHATYRRYFADLPDIPDLAICFAFPKF